MDKDSKNFPLSSNPFQIFPLFVKTGIAFLVIAALIALVIVDRKMSRRMLLVYGVTLVQMILLGVVNVVVGIVAQVL